MKIVVTGCKGQVGWELVNQGKEMGFEIIPLDLPEFDITDKDAVYDIVTQPHVSIVINAAAYTAVDKAESESTIAFSVNQDGPAYLASSCVEAGIPLFHISTDYVYDGTKKGVYVETDPVSPLGVYGRSKAFGDAAVQERLKEHIILRTSWVCGVHGNNFVKTMLKFGQEKEILRVVADQYGCPTFAFDIAKTLLTLASGFRDGQDMTWGTFHYTGKGVTTWYDFAKHIFEIAQEYITLKVKTIEPITTAEYPT
ncbi:MAG: dTDP-4-dehydrorhamnose reductase, partial [Desulfobacterales bacterium]|nr:dTDP-4-dehydrorhamnose reductase [Desulfobacterales bacterium]